MSQDLIENRFLTIPVSAFVFSLVLHGSFLIFFVSIPILESMGISILPKKKILQDAYQSFIQVDVVALPDTLPNERPSLDTALPIVDKPAQAIEPEKVETKKDDVLISPEAKKEEEAKKAAEQKKKVEQEAKEKDRKKQADQEKALKKIQEEAKREAALKALNDKGGKVGRKKLSGNVLSKGTSLTGVVGTAKDQYAGRIVQAALQNFNIYFWQQKKGLAAVVHLELFPTGKVRSRQIIKKSIDATYDSAVLQAIDAATFPPPEDPSILDEGFNITFIP